MKVELETRTLAVLISGLYCVNTNVEAIAIPESVWIAIAEKLEFFLPIWDYEVISFEEWINTCLMIVPKVLLSEDDLNDIMTTTLAWEYPNGNMMLVISMDIEPINRRADR